MRALTQVLPKLAVVRGIALRPFDINSFERCNRFEVVFIHCLNQELRSFEAKFIRLEAKPIFAFDPISAITRKTTHVSWIYLNNLEQCLESADVVNTIETYFFLSRQCAKISRKLKKPLVISVSQNIYNHFSKFVVPYSLNTRFVVENADLFVAISELAKSYLRSLGVEEEKIKVIQPGIDTTVFKPAKDRNPETLRVLFVGNLTKSKGIPELLKACNMLWKAGTNLELWICGAGKLESLVQCYSQKYPVKYLGFVNYEEIANIYRQCDIFCLPSRDMSLFEIRIVAEQFGFVFLEAMSSGLPIVTTNCGSIPEVVGPRNIVVSQRSVDQLSNALKNLINDEEKRKQIGTSNRERVEKFFDAKKQCEKFQGELARLL